jgi:hypothetical protein
MSTRLTTKNVLMCNLVEAIYLVKDVPLLRKRYMHFNHFRPEDNLSDTLNLRYEDGLVTAAWRNNRSSPWK